MPPFFYRLSNRQQKELMIRGQRLRIAVPVRAAWLDEYEPIELAVHLLREHREHVVAAECGEVDVAKPDTATPGLAGVVGEITGQDKPMTIPYTVLALIVTLDPPAKPRGEMPLQWPGRCIGEGWEVPRVQD